MNRTTYIRAVMILIFIIQHAGVMAETFGSAVAVDDQVKVIENSGATIIDVFANDTINKGDVVTTFTQPANGLVNLELFGMIYQPDNGYCNNGATTDDFTYTLTGGSTATVSITVTCLAGNPTAQVIPVNQLHWLLFLLVAIIFMTKFKNTVK